MRSPITTQLDRQFEHLNRHHARRRLLRRWADDPALAGRTAADIVELCEQPTLDQNPVVAALLQHHHRGDADAATILLTALRPMVITVVTKRYGTNVEDEVIDNHWAAASHLLGHTDPHHTPSDTRGRPVPFLTWVGDHLDSHLRRFDPAHRRWNDRRRKGRDTITVDFERTEQLINTGEPHHQTSVEDTVIARLELRRVVDAVDRGDVAHERWQQLLEHRLGITPTPLSTKDRVAVHRTAHRLAGLVGHAA